MSAGCDPFEDLVEMHFGSPTERVSNILPIEDKDPHVRSYLRPMTPMEMPEYNGRGVVNNALRKPERSDVRVG